MITENRYLNIVYRTWVEFGELTMLDNEEDFHEMAVSMENYEVCLIPVER
jgi:hypothetical protein